ncbi:MAG: AbrB/MazE/SpoVT family DNA-binding domain-containing protein [Longimicrobiales bacterium]
MYLTDKIELEAGMAEVSTTRLSSRGQVVIPEEIRRRLGLEPGAQFVVVGDADTVVLKRIEAPSLAEFDTLVSRARKAAKSGGLERKDIAAAIRRVRKSR